ncbi:MAG: hypothetical protein OEY89_13710 [Gammaproteobacteria bacterium]|nr:hypothetical protein [Gammaproteobacteria bacterium]
MEYKLPLLKKRLILIATLSFALTPAIGYGIAISFGMININDLLQYPGGYILIGATLLLLVAQIIHFTRYLNPITNWITQHPTQRSLPEPLNQRLNNFSDNYWAFFLIYALSVPTIQHWYGLYPTGTAAYTNLMQCILLQLVITIMVGMPGYLLSLSTLGKLAYYIGHTEVHVSMRAKMLLIGGYLPVLCTAVIVK